MTYSLRPELLDKIRANHNLSSDEALARPLNLSLGTIQGVRAGRQPSLGTAIRILNAADVDSIKALILKGGAA